MEGSGLESTLHKQVELFNDRYDVVEANTPELLEVVYRLRYQVYCRERGFEDPDDFPEGRESDEFDSRSAHSVVLDRVTGSYLGTVRMILPLFATPHRSFPIQRLTSASWTTGTKARHLLSSTEVSRFAISKELRKQVRGEKDLRATSGSGAVNAESSQAQSFVTLGLIRALVQMSREYCIDEWYAVMEPSLLRLLSRFSIYFRPIGPVVDYHGMRQPCHANMMDLLKRVERERPGVWEVLTDEGRLLHDREKVFHLAE